MHAHNRGRFVETYTHPDPLSPYLNTRSAGEQHSSSDQGQYSSDEWTHDTPSIVRNRSDMSVDFSTGETLAQTHRSDQATITTGRERAANDDGLPEEVARRGYRLLDRPDVRYLGFVPSRNDKRPYLNAVAVVGKIPDGQIVSFAYPVSSMQVWTWIIFGLLLALAAAGSYFYIKNVIPSDGNKSKS